MNIPFYLATQMLAVVAAASLLLSCSEPDPNQLTDEQIQEISGYLAQADSSRNQYKYRAALLQFDAVLGIDKDNKEALNGLAQLLVLIGDGSAGEEQLNVYQKLHGPLSNAQKLLKINALILQNKLNSASTLSQAFTPENSQDELEIALLQAEIAFAKQQIKPANQWYLKAKNLDNKDIRPILGLAKIGLAQDDNNAVEQYTQKAESLGATNTDLLIWKGRLALLNERWVAAEEAFVDALIELSQTDIMTAKKYTVLTNIVTALQRQNKLADAEKYQKTIIESGPGQLKGEYDDAVLVYQSGDLVAAQQAFLDIMRKAPNHGPSGTMLGIIQYQNDNLIEAERYLSEYLDLESAPDGAKKILAMTRLRLNQVQGAQTVLDSLAQTSGDEDADLLALLGVSSLVSGDTETGISSIEKALAKEPQRSSLRLRLAEFYSLNGQLDQALQALEPIKADDENKSAALALEVTALVRAEQLDNARQRVTDWIKNRPQDALAQVVSGGLYVSEGKNTQARQAFEQALTVDPSSSTALINLARLDISDNNLEKAKQRYQQLIDIDPSDLVGLRGVLAVANSQNQSQQALDSLNKLQQQNPDNTTIQFVIAEYYLSEDNLSEALLKANEGFAKTPNDQYGKRVLNAIYYRRALDAVRDQSFAKAEEDVAQALTILPDHIPSLTLLAGLASNSNKLDTALDIAKKLQSLRPNEAGGFEIAGDLLMRQQKIAQAIATYQQGFSVDKSETIANKLANAYLQNNQGADALAFTQQWVNDDPRNLSARLILANAYQSQDLKSQAIDEYQELLIRAPDNPLVLNNLAWLYFQTGNPKDLQLAEQAVQLAPENGSVLDTYGWLLLNRGASKQAVSVLAKAAELEPARPDILEHYAKALDQTGQIAESKAVMEKIQALFNSQ